MATYGGYFASATADEISASYGAGSGFKFWDVDVAGSNPVTPTSEFINFFIVYGRTGCHVRQLRGVSQGVILGPA